MKKSFLPAGFFLLTSFLFTSSAQDNSYLKNHQTAPVIKSMKLSREKFLKLLYYHDHDGQKPGFYSGNKILFTGYPIQIKPVINLPPIAFYDKQTSAFSKVLTGLAAGTATGVSITNNYRSGEFYLPEFDGYQSIGSFLVGTGLSTFLGLRH